MELWTASLILVVFVASSIVMSADAAPVTVYAHCNIQIESSGPVANGLIIVHHIDTCRKWVCDKRTNKGYIESCAPDDMSPKCEDIDLYSRKCYKSYEQGSADLKYPNCCSKQIEICPGHPGYDFVRFKMEETKYALEEPFLWCARDSP